MIVRWFSLSTASVTSMQLMQAPPERSALPCVFTPVHKWSLCKLAFAILQHFKRAARLPTVLQQHWYSKVIDSMKGKAALAGTHNNRLHFCAELRRLLFPSNSASVDRQVKRRLALASRSAGDENKKSPLKN